MINEKNMGPVRSSDEARERGRNGGIASGNSRRRKKEIRERLKEALNCAVVNPKVKSMMKQGITPAHAGKTYFCIFINPQTTLNGKAKILKITINATMKSPLQI